MKAKLSSSKNLYNFLLFKDRICQKSPQKKVVSDTKTSWDNFKKFAAKCMVEIIKQQFKKIGLKHLEKDRALNLFTKPTIRNKKVK